MTMQNQPGAGSAPPQLSPDGQWWWDGADWVPASPAPPVLITPTAARRRAGGWSWARRIASALLGLVALAFLLFFISLAAGAKPIDPVVREGTLTKFIASCPVPGDVGDQCALIDLDQFCYRIAPTDFQPALPDLTSEVGQTIRFTVDRDNFESSRLVGDPYCNFQVARIELVVNGVPKTFQTSAMTQPESVGHPVGDILGIAAVPAVALFLLLGWNTYTERRLRRRA